VGGEAVPFAVQGGECFLSLFNQLCERVQVIPV
jgi:hypothetical protein